MFQIKASKLFTDTYRSTARILIHRGGSSSSKTWSILQYLVAMALEHPNLVISVVRQSFPALRKSNIRDLQQIINLAGLDKRVRHWKTTSTFEFYDTGSIIECFACDDAQKIRGPRRDLLFVDESNEISFEIFRQLNMRTRLFTVLAFNPSDEGTWINTKLEQERAAVKKDVQVVVSNYLDNPFLTVQERQEIEFLQPRFDDDGKQISGDESFYRVYGLGEYGHVSGRVFDNWNIIDDFPTDIEHVYLGLDFGFVNDPSAIVMVGRNGNNIYLKELAYDRGLSVHDMAQIIRKHGNHVCYADSSDPRAISDLIALGCHVIKATKGPNSILTGIQLIHKFNIAFTSDSLNLQKEYMMYRWDIVNDEYINVPVDAFNHLVDATRYVIYSKYRNRAKFLVS